jgi:hypothetical protein
MMASKNNDHSHPFWELFGRIKSQIAEAKRSALMASKPSDET